MSELVGYVRVSTEQQSLDQQHDALTRAGVGRIFEDKMSGARADRPGLRELLAYVREGDTVVVIALDRLGRTLSGIFDTVNTLADRGVHVRALRESIDTSTSVGRALLLPIFAAIAEYERILIAERSAADRQARRARGEQVGRTPKLDAKQRALAVRLRAAGESIRTIHETLGCSRATLYRVLREESAA